MYMYVYAHADAGVKESLLEEKSNQQRRLYLDKKVSANLALYARRHLDLDAVSNRLATFSDVVHQ